MAYGSGWELEEPPAFWARVDDYNRDDPRLEEMIEGLSWALLTSPTDLPNGWQLAGTFWYATLGMPPTYLVFYEVDEAAQRITYSTIERAP